jgi:hypothetical protein
MKKKNVHPKVPPNAPICLTNAGDLKIAFQDMKAGRTNPPDNFVQV